MTKILSKSGDSLADVYDVQGSIAGIDQLQSQDVNLVHEMGSTVFSERFNLVIQKIESTGMAQSVNFLAVLGSLPATPWRVLGVNVFTDVAGRLDSVVVTLHDTGLGRDMPLFVWKSTVDSELVVRLRNDASTTSNQVLLRSNGVGLVPTMGCGTDQRENVEQLAMQGTVKAFGAGTLDITATVLIGFAELGGVSSRGLPLPGW